MLLEIGRVVKPHGIRGEVIVELVTNRPEQRLAPGCGLHVDRARRLVVQRASPHQGRWIVAFAGVGDRNAAEALRGTILRSEALEEKDTLWVHELIGLEVVDTRGRRHGTVQAVEENPASDLLVLHGERLVPLTFVVDRAPGRVVIDPPEGLLDP